MRFLVRICRCKRTYSAMAPDLLGCVAAARTIEKTRALMAEAMALHMSALRKNGEKIPKPRMRFHLDVHDFEDEELCTWIDAKTLQAV